MTLKELLLRRGLTYRDLSAQIKRQTAVTVSAATIGHIATGKTEDPYPKTMWAIAETLGIEMDQIDEFRAALDRAGKEFPLTTFRPQGEFSSIGTVAAVPLPVHSIP